AADLRQLPATIPRRRGAPAPGGGISLPLRLGVHGDRRLDGGHRRLSRSPGPLWADAGAGACPVGYGTPGLVLERPRPRAPRHGPARRRRRSEEHTSELQSLTNLVCRLLLEKKKKKINKRAILNRQDRYIYDKTPLSAQTTCT